MRTQIYVFIHIHISIKFIKSRQALDEAIYGQDDGTCDVCTLVRAGERANQPPAVFHCCSRGLCAGKTQTTGDSCTKTVSVFGATYCNQYADLETVSSFAARSDEEVAAFLAERAAIPEKAKLARQPLDPAIYGEDDDTCAGCTRTRKGRSVNLHPEVRHTCERGQCSGQTRGGQCGNRVAVYGDDLRQGRLVVQGLHARQIGRRDERDSRG